MSIGIIGSGNIGGGFARALASKNIPAVIANSRGPESLKALTEELGPSIRAVTVAEAARADIVLVAVPWDAIKDALGGLPDWNGRIVIDSNNPLVHLDPDSADAGDTANPFAALGIKPADIGGRSSSVVFSNWVPGARVVKAFNHLNAQVFDSLQVPNGQRVFFLAGDDADAKVQVGKLIAQLGLASIDLGSLESGGRLIQIPFGPLSIVNLVAI
ncbi:NADPH-dependent F420 reductase [Paraburkholderia pallida]|uniref:NADP oxidoreductase n=1 Tax=Paraburkholderia pallida TaxID=2547399 RepID=A0A4P7D8M8_9BURK|nr:NAD(P)-binding domain-containing protein [Paraburkholderia pallida]QBR03530.1 NADP oxidoreductase [Paraburkholderia pallida]